MNLFQKNKGSITIFLVIILVPVIVVCSVFVDVSRIKLAQSLAYSSGDLTLNTVLTQYDQDLEDYYGLMASCQNIDEFYDVAEQYFAACMISQGISVTDAQKWGKSLKSIFIDGSDINDFIGIDPSVSKADVKEVPNANLANAAMMKNQVMDFMKYRAPVELIGEAIDGGKQKGFASKILEVKDKIEIMPEETKVQNDKTKYYEAENELLTDALVIFEILKKYEGMKLSTTDMNTMKSSMETLEPSYKELHKKYVTYWCNTKNAVKETSVGTQLGSVSTSVSGVVYKDALKRYISNCDTKKTEYETALQTVSDKLATISYHDLNHMDKVNSTQYWIQMKRDLGKDYESYVKKAVAFKKAYLDMVQAYDNRDRGEKKVGEKTEYAADGTTKKKDIMEPYDIKDEDGIEGSYNSTNGSASPVINAMSTKDIYKVSSYLETYSKSAVDNGWIDRTKATNEIKAAIDDQKLVKQYDTLVEAQGYLKQIIDKLPDLKEKAKTCKERFEQWEKDANANRGKGSDSIDSDCEEIAQLKANTDPSLGPIRAGSDISDKDVDDFQKRLQAVYDLMDSYRNTLEGIQYRGTTIFGTGVDKNVYNFDAGIYKLDSDFDTAAKGTKGNCTKPPVVAKGEGAIPVLQAELDKYIEDTFDFYEEIASMEGVSISNMPELHEYKDFGSIKGSSIQPTKFDEWLHEKFDLENRVTSEVVKGLLKKFKELLKSLKNGFGADFIPYDNSNYVCKENEISSVEDTPSKLAKAGKNTNKDFDDGDKDVDEQVEESTKVGSIFDCFNFATLLQSGRDDLYTLTYIMNMFNYETYHLEGMYNAARIPASDKTKKNIYYVCKPKEFTVKPGTAKDIYNDTSMIGNSTSGWLNESPTYKYNKSLTNKMIGKTHSADNDANKISWSYGNEVEYILYGGTNSANKAKVNASIFFIRYALNLGPVMSHFYKDDVVIAIGDGVAAATMGVIPAPLVKAIICLGICAAESAVDLNYLLSGLPVVFFKSIAKDNNQLFIRLDIGNGTKFAEEFVSGKEFKAQDIFSVRNVKIPESDIYFSYSDYLSLFLFIELCAVEDNVYYRVADVIQANMTHNPDLEYKDKEGGFKMVDAKTYFQIKADKIKVKPMMLKLPYAQNFDSVKDVTNTENWNTFSYKATRGY